MLELRTLQALAHRDRDAEARLARDLSKWASVRLVAIAWRTAVYLHDLPGAARITHGMLDVPAQFVDQERVAKDTITARLLLAHLAFAGGRRRAARAQLDSLAAVSPLMALETRARLALASFPTPSASQLRLLRDSVAQSRARGIWPGWTSDDLARVRLSLLTLLSASLGDSSDAFARLLQIDSLGEWLGGAGWRDAFRRLVRAELALRDGRLADALRVLEEANPEMWFGWRVNNPFNWEDGLRFLRGTLLEENGRPLEALRWYASLGEDRAVDLPYLAPAHLRRAEIYERVGKKAAAAEEYRQFIALWRDADPELQPIVSRARARLARLSS